MADTLPFFMRTLILCLLAATARSVEIAGSDALAETLQPALVARAATAGAADKVHFDGSLPARNGVREGKVDIAVIFLREADNLDKAADGTAIRRFPLGSAAAYVYVHPSHPLREISLPILANLYGAGQRSDYKFWSDVPGLTLPEPVLAFTYVPGRHMAQTVFQGVALGGRAFKASVRQRVDLELAKESISGRTNAILVSATPLPAGAGRLLQVADGREGRSTTAYAPDEANIFNGDYPLRLPLVVCIREDRVAANADTLRWLLSETAAEHIRKAGMVPAPKAIRDRLAQRLDSK